MGEKKPELQQSSDLKIAWEIDPAFADDSGLRRIASEFSDWEREIGMMEPVEQLRIWVFPRNQLAEVNQRLKEEGFPGEIRFLQQTGHAKAWKDNPGKVEVFLPFTSQDSKEVVEKTMAHELAHLLGGMPEEERIEGKSDEEICRLLGLSGKEYDSIKQEAKEGDAKLTGFVNQGLVTYLVGVHKGEKVKYKISGHGLEELVVDWVVGMMFDLQKERGDKIGSKLAAIVGEGELLYSYLTGDLTNLKRIFSERKGFSLDMIIAFLDKAQDIIDNGRGSLAAQKEANFNYLQAAVLLQIDVRDKAIRTQH